MYIETNKGTRYFHRASLPKENGLSIDSYWPITGTNVFGICKTRPNVIQPRYVTFVSKVIHHLVITKSDILDYIKDKAYRHLSYMGVIAISVDACVRKFNTQNNTQYKYVSYGKEYNHVAGKGLTFPALYENDLEAINNLPDDFTVKLEVYNKDTFKLVTTYTKKEKLQLEQLQKDNLNKSIFDTFLRQETENLLAEFGLYYHSYDEVFRFKTAKAFKCFLDKAICMIINEKLKSKGMCCKSAISTYKTRSSKIDCEIQPIIRACDITFIKEETNNE